jgi:hypothetical protein
MPALTLSSPKAVNAEATRYFPYIQIKTGSRSFVGSWTSDSNATTSNLPGPGRALSQLFSAAGRRLEIVVDRTAARLGLGFDGIARRLLLKLRVPHLHCRAWPEFVHIPVVELAVELGSGRCAGCDRRYMATLGSENKSDITDLLSRLVPSIE